MSILGLMENTADTAQTTPDLSASPSTNSERFLASWRAGQSPDRYWNEARVRIGKAEQIIDSVHSLTGERYLNPYDVNSPMQDEMDLMPAEIQAKRLAALREGARKARSKADKFGGMPDDLLDPDSIDIAVAGESRAARTADERLTGTGGGVGAFLGAAAAETASPHGIVSSFIPVTRMGGAVAQVGLRAFAANVAKEAAFQGGAAAVVQSFGTLIDYQTRKQFGTEQTNEQIMEEIISAAGGGAIIGGAFRAIHIGVLKLASRGVDIPEPILDRARMMEEGDLYGNKNPLRINPGQMEVATDQAMGAAVLGRAASPNVDVSPAMTLHEAARRLNPELMARYDAAVAWRDEARAILAPTDETIAMLKKRMDDADAAIAAAGPQTGEAAERLGATARMARLVHDDAVARKAAMGGGEAPALPPVPEGMVRMFHGGDNATAGGERHVAATFEYARDYNEGKPVWYVDVPADSPWLKQVDTTGTNMPRQIMNSVAPEDVMAGAKLVPEPAATPPTAPTLENATQAATDLGSVADIAAHARRDPDGARARLEAVREQVRVIEQEIAQKYGVKRSELHTIEDLVTPAEDQFLFRNSMTSVEQIDRVLGAMANRPDTLSGAARELSVVLRKLPTNLKKLSPEDEISLLRLQVVMDDVARMGGDPKAVLIDALKQHAARFGDPNDAADMLARTLEQLKSLHDAGFQMQGQKATPALPGPAAALPGAGPAETTVSTSMRQQAAMADLELRDLIPEISKVMKQAGEEVAAATRAADEFLAGAKAADEGAALAKLAPDDLERVLELQKQIPEYEKFRDAAATPEEKAAWQQAIDDFNTEVAKIMDLDIADQAPVKAAMKRLEAAPSNPMQAPRPAPPEPKPASTKLPGESAEDKAILQQAKQIMDNEKLAGAPEARAQMEEIDIKEQQYLAATGCVVGVL